MRDQRRHRGVEAVALFQLNCEAFGQAARAHAGRIEVLQHAEYGFQLGERRTELFGNGPQIGGEIAGLVDGIDQVLGDHAMNRIGDRQRELFGEMIAQRRLGGDEGFEIVVAVLAAAGADTGPFRIGGGLGLSRALRRLAGIGKDVLDRSVERVLDRRRAVDVGFCPLVLGRFARGISEGIRGVLARLRGLLALGALQQRVALQFTFHIGRQIEIGELQQLDGLHQLRRHHERLALPEFESLR
jgi:hypothetical protein